MTYRLQTALRDEIASLLDEAITDAESVGSTERVGDDTLVVVDDDGNRYTVVVTFDGFGE